LPELRDTITWMSQDKEITPAYGKRLNVALSALLALMQYLAKHKEADEPLPWAESWSRDAVMPVLRMFITVRLSRDI
jgi:hypothetical protein